MPLFFFLSFISSFCLAVLGLEPRAFQMLGKHCYAELCRSLIALIKNVRATYIAFQVQVWEHKTMQGPQIQHLRCSWNKIARGGHECSSITKEDGWKKLSLGKSQSSTYPKSPKENPLLWSRHLPYQLSMPNDPTTLCIKNRFYTQEIRGYQEKGSVQAVYTESSLELWDASTLKRE